MNSKIIYKSFFIYLESVWIVYLQERFFFLFYKLIPFRTKKSLRITFMYTNNFWTVFRNKMFFLMFPSVFHLLSQPATMQFYSKKTQGCIKIILFRDTVLKIDTSIMRYRRSELYLKIKKTVNLYTSIHVDSMEICSTTDFTI